MCKFNLFLPTTKNIIQKAKNKSIPNHSRLIRNNFFQVLTRSSKFEGNFDKSSAPRTTTTKSFFRSLTDYMLAIKKWLLELAHFLQAKKRFCKVSCL